MSRPVAIEGHRLIRAPVQRVWHLLSRLESHPRYVTLWMTADVKERSPTAATVEFRGFFGGLPITSAQRITLRPPARIEFRQVRGELRELTGAYVLKESDGETELIVQLTIDAGIPIFSDSSVQQIIVGHIDGTLGRVKASAERDLVRLTPRRIRPPEAAGAPAERAIMNESPQAAGESVLVESASRPGSANAGPTDAGPNAAVQSAAPSGTQTQGASAAPAGTPRVGAATPGGPRASAAPAGTQREGARTAGGTPVASRSGAPMPGDATVQPESGQRRLRRGRRRRRRRGRWQEGGRAPQSGGQQSQGTP